MACDRTLWLTTLLAAAGLLSATLPPAARRVHAASLQPGFATVDRRSKDQLELRFDPNPTLYPAGLQGRTLVIRRQVKKVDLPHSWRALAEEWVENGTARVLPAHLTRGALVARLLWEDKTSPVKPGDRAEVCPVPDDAATPVILALRCLSLRGPKGDEPVAAPAEEILLHAAIFCPTAEHPRCEWTVDLGTFRHAGGQSAGKTVRGPALVRWRPPAVPDPEARVRDKATIRLKATAGWHGKSAEQTLVIRVAEPTGEFQRVHTLAAAFPGVVGAAGDDGVEPAPMFADASHVAAGPLDSIYVADASAGRLVHWRRAGVRYVALPAGAVAALRSLDGAAYLAQGASILRVGPEAGAAASVGALPGVQRFVGLGVSAAGDVCVLDSGDPPRVHALATVGGAPRGAAPLALGGDSPWLARFCLDPLTCDAYILDTRERAIRQWRTLDGTRYHALSALIPVGKTLDQFKDPVALLPRLDADRASDLPIRLVFGSGAFSGKWTGEGQPLKWEPEVVRPPATLSRAEFAARAAAPLHDGDVLLGGQAGSDEQAAALVAQVAPDGTLRRTLPRPFLPPRFAAAAPDGTRYTVCHAGTRWAKGSARITRLGPDGWVVGDLGALETIYTVYGLRADRGSADHVLLVAAERRRQSCFRVDATAPGRALELCSAALPGKRIPDHHAVDAASSADHIVVLDRDGKVLLFANKRPIKYLGHFETELRGPAAVAVFSNLPIEGGARRTYVCVLPAVSGATAIAVWDVRAPAFGDPTAVRIGTFASLASPVTLDTGFPDHPELLYVLDAGGARVRAFDVPAIASAVSRGLTPKLDAKPLLDKLPFSGEGLDMAVGPGQVVHVLDPKTHAIHTYARRP